MKVCIATGGTGGHVFPAVSLWDQLEKTQGMEVFVLMDKKGLFYLSNEQKHKVYEISAGALVGQSLWKKVCSLYLLWRGFYESFVFLKKHRPQIIVGFGGYASFPVLLSGYLLGVKLILHEQNTTLSRVNRYFWNKSERRLTAFELDREFLNTYALLQDFQVVGMPLRSIFYEPWDGIYCVPKEGEEFRIFIVGGSQGSKIFTKFAEILALLSYKIRKSLYIVHQVRGGEDKEKIELIYAQAQIKSCVKEFFDPIVQEYRKAHFIVSRAGASSIAEIMMIKRPVLFVPYARSARQHQKKNVAVLEEEGIVDVFTEHALVMDSLQIVKFFEKIIYNQDYLMLKYEKLKKFSYHKDALAMILHHIVHYQK